MSQFPRPSTYSSVGGFAGAGASHTSASSRIQEKQRELEGLLALKEASAQLVSKVERLGDEMDVLADGGQAVASVLASWQGIFRAMRIAQTVENPEGSMPETLVRIPVAVTAAAATATADKVEKDTSRS